MSIPSQVSFCFVSYTVQNRPSWALLVNKQLKDGWIDCLMDGWVDEWVDVRVKRTRTQIM